MHLSHSTPPEISLTCKVQKGHAVFSLVATSSGVSVKDSDMFMGATLNGIDSLLVSTSSLAG